MNFLFFLGQADPSGALTLASVGVIVSLIAGVYQGVLMANSKVHAERIRLAVMDCEQRCRECEQRCEERCKAKDLKAWELAEQLQKEMARTATWQARYESLAASVKPVPTAAPTPTPTPTAAPGSKSSPTPTAPA